MTNLPVCPSVLSDHSLGGSRRQTLNPMGQTEAVQVEIGTMKTKEKREGKKWQVLTSGTKMRINADGQLPLLLARRGDSKQSPTGICGSVAVFLRPVLAQDE